MTYLCHCGNTLHIISNAQTKCAQCGAIYQVNPLTGGVEWMNVLVVTTNNTLHIERTWETCAQS